MQRLNPFAHAIGALILSTMTVACANTNTSTSNVDTSDVSPPVEQTIDQASSSISETTASSEGGAEQQADADAEITSQSPQEETVIDSPAPDVIQTSAKEEGSLPSQSTTQAVNARCVIKGASGDVRFDGDCLFAQFGGNGSFSVESPSGMIDGYLSISVSIIETGVAEVRGLTPDGINSRWGEARRSASDSACWIGSDFTICAY